jgi:hypothetical protein
MLREKPLKREAVRIGEKALYDTLEKIIYDCRYFGMNENEMILYIPKNWDKLRRIYKYDGI